MLFSLEAWHWKKERGIPPNDRRAITGPVLFGEQSDAGKCNKRLPPVGLFEPLPLLILEVCCEKEGRRRLEEDEEELMSRVPVFHCFHSGGPKILTLGI